MQRVTNPPATETPVQTICRMATEIISTPYGEYRRQKERTLSNFLAEGYSVDIHEGLETPISRHAAAGHHQEVRLLHERYNANMSNAIFGYAAGNRVSTVNKLISNNCYRSYALAGYAYAGNTAETEKLDKQYGELYDSGSQLRHNDAILLIGYAAGGHHTMVNDLLSRFGRGWSFALYGYAASGQEDMANELLKKNYRGPDRLYFGGLIKGYAIGGFTQQVDKLLALKPVPPYAFTHSDPSDAIISTILHYTNGGHFKEANKLLSGSPHLIKDENFFVFVIHISLEKYYYAEANKLYINRPSNDIKEYFYPNFYLLRHGSFPWSADNNFSDYAILRTLTLIEDSAFRKIIFKSMKEQHRNNIKYMSHKLPANINFKDLLEKSNQLRSLMSEFNLDFHRALTLQTNPRSGDLLMLMRHFKLSYDQSFSIIKEPGLINFMMIWADKVCIDIIAMCTSFTTGLAHQDAKGLAQKSIDNKFAFFHQKKQTGILPTFRARFSRK